MSNIEVTNWKTEDMSFAVRQFVGISDFGIGQVDNVWSIQFNLNGESDIHPRWGENIENFYVTNGGERLIEKNWDYTSIDGETSFRPFNFNVNIDTHTAWMLWRVGRFQISSSTSNAYVVDVRTYDNAPLVILNAHVQINKLDDENTPALSVGGNPGTQSFALFAPTQLIGSAVALGLNLPVTSGANANGFSILGNSSYGDIVSQIHNYSATGGVEFMLWAQSTTRDAYVRFLTGSSDWAIGNDSSASGAFKIANSPFLGTNDRFEITPAGAVRIPALAGLGTRNVVVDANGVLSAA